MKSEIQTEKRNGKILNWNKHQRKETHGNPRNADAEEEGKE